MVTHGEIEPLPSVVQRQGLRLLPAKIRIAAEQPRRRRLQRRVAGHLGGGRVLEAEVVGGRGGRSAEDESRNRQQQIPVPVGNVQAQPAPQGQFQGVIQGQGHLRHQAELAVAALVESSAAEIGAAHQFVGHHLGGEAPVDGGAGQQTPEPHALTRGLVLERAGDAALPRRPIEVVVVVQLAEEAGHFPPTASGRGAAMAGKQQMGSGVIRFRQRREAGVGAGPAVELVLVTIEQVGFMVGAAMLQLRGEPVELVIAVGAAAIAAGTGIGNGCGDVLPAAQLEGFRGAQPQEPQSVAAHPERHVAARAHGRDFVAYGGHGGIEARHGVVDAGENVRRREHRRVEGHVGEVVAGLWIEQGDGGDVEPGVLEQAAAHRYVCLAFGEAARLQIDPGIIAQRRDRRGVAAGGLQIRHPLGDHGQRIFRGAIGLGLGLGRQRGGGRQQQQRKQAAQRREERFAMNHHA